MPTKPAITTVPLSALLPSFMLSLEERGLSPKTVKVYERTCRQLPAWLKDNGLPDDVAGVSAPHIRAFLAAEARRTSAESASQHYRNLNVIFKWLVREGERDAPSPMDRVDRPKTTEKVKPILSEDQLRALMRTCEGQSFEERRDRAILMIFVDTGTRVSGVGGLRLTDIDLGRRLLTVTLKGGDEHLAPIGRKTVAAIDRYVRARRSHRHAGESDWLWLGKSGRDTGRLGPDGIHDMVMRRGAQAGIDGLTPHWFRRTGAHSLLAAGMTESDVAMVCGWKTTVMVRKYAGALAAERAREAHARLSPGDRL